jgi:hypothetical protein
MMIGSDKIGLGNHPSRQTLRVTYQDRSQAMVCQPFDNLDQRVVFPAGYHRGCHDFLNSEMLPFLVEIRGASSSVGTFETGSAVAMEKNDHIRVGQHSRKGRRVRTPHVQLVHSVGAHDIQGSLQSIVRIAGEGRAVHDVSQHGVDGQSAIECSHKVGFGDNTGRAPEFVGNEEGVELVFDEMVDALAQRSGCGQLDELAAHNL